MKRVFYLIGLGFYVVGVLFTLITIALTLPEPPFWLQSFMGVFLIIIGILENVFHAGLIERVENADDEYNATHGSRSYSYNESSNTISESYESANRDHAIWLNILLFAVALVAFPIECIVRAIKA